jgi:hypothetical protein
VNLSQPPFGDRRDSLVLFQAGAMTNSNIKFEALRSCGPFGLYDDVGTRAISALYYFGAMPVR